MNIKLWENEIPDYNKDFDTPNNMTFYPVETDKALPCVVIYPGGGYTHRAFHEGEPIAQFFNSRGLHAAVVDYRVLPNLYPCALEDAQRAIKILRSRADELKIDSDKIIVLGFSAGGHLAAMCSLLDDVTVKRENPDEIDMNYSCKTNGAVLSYAALSNNKEWGIYRCGENLLGVERCKMEWHYFSMENHVTPETPPMFLWHTSDDTTVDVRNSLVFAERLRENQVPFEMHIYPSGRHGLGLALDHEDISHWADQAADWILKNI